MDLISAIAKNMDPQDQELSVFDWDKAATIIRDQKLHTVYAGLKEDWDLTSGPILINGSIPEAYTFLASTWATPAFSVDNEIFVTCYKMQSEVPNWNASTFWPESARRIIDPFLLSELR